MVNRCPDQAKADVVAKSRTVLKDKAGMTSLRIFGLRISPH